MNFNRKFLLLGIFFLITLPLFSQGTYLELNLNSGADANPFARQRSPLEIFRVIDKASSDDRVRGIILNIGSISEGREYLWELRNSLEQFKSSGKKIIAFLNYADLDIYTLASVGDKVVMGEMGDLNILGYSIGMNYARRALDKLGIGVRELRYYRYKSAAETFVRDSMSDANRLQYGAYLDDIFNLTRDTLMSARNWSGDDFNAILNKEYLYSARGALSRGLIDGIGGRDTVLEMIREIEGSEIEKFVLYGDIESSLTSSQIKYAPKAAGGLFSKAPTIAVVYADGQTDMKRGMAAMSLSKTIMDLADNRRVSAIVIRMNSPGGSAEAADCLASAVLYARQKKPVVVSMGQTAASGGYWASMNASHIVANPYTLTGSIGVISTWFYDNGLSGKLGITTDFIQRGDHADLAAGFLLPHRNLTDKEEERFKFIIQDTYRVFIEKVALSRNMDIDKVESVAQGRVYSGTRALQEGLIDSVGGLSDALRIARQLANIPDNKAARYREYPEPKLIDTILARFPMAGIFLKGRGGAASSIFDSLLPGSGLPYRLERNGQAMPILPLEF